MYRNKIAMAFLSFVASGVLLVANQASDLFATFADKTSDQTPVAIEEESSMPEIVSSEDIDLLGAAGDKVYGYYTPQDFGAVANDDNPDTAAFRSLFKAAYSGNGKYNKSPGSNWVHTYGIFIPSGTYIIDGPIVDSSLGVPAAMFNVFGAGRECTTIRFTGDVLFDNQMIFGFSTFRDIAFEGNKTNTFMNLKDNSFGVQRLQFMSCSFSSFKTILNTIESTVNISEITFNSCKISGCGTSDTRCKLFVLNDQQSVDWRFSYTDIESFAGDAFYYATGAHVTLLGGSIIPSNESGSGTVFHFAPKANTAGNSNSPHVLCMGSRFEIRGTSTLLQRESNTQSLIRASFHSCNLGTESNNSPNFLLIDNPVNILFEDCYECANVRLKGDFTGDKTIRPQIRFVNCMDYKVDNIIQGSTVTSSTGGNARNNMRITVDDEYDFYLTNGGYLHTVAGLKECKQYVDLTNYTYITLDANRKIQVPNPYGFVKYVELTIPDVDYRGNKYSSSTYPVELTMYVNGKQKGSPIQLTLESAHTHVIVVEEYVDDMYFVVSKTPSTAPNVTMNMEIVKY